MNKFLKDMKKNQESQIHQWYDIFQKTMTQSLQLQKKWFDISEKGLDSFKSSLPKESSPVQFLELIFLTEAQKVLAEQQKSLNVDKLKNYQINVNQFFYDSWLEYEDVINNLKKVDVSQSKAPQLDELKNISQLKTVEDVKEFQLKLLESLKNVAHTKDVEHNLTVLTEFYQKKMQDIKGLTF